MATTPIDDSYGPHFRPGAYACQCPSRLPQLSAVSQLASAQHSERLIEFLSSRSALGASVPLDQLVVEQLNELRRLQELEAAQQFLPPGQLPPFQARFATPFKLADKRAVGQVLLWKRRKLDRNQTTSLRLIGSLANGTDSPNYGSAHGHGANFALGALLEAEAALDMLARSHLGGQSKFRPATDLRFNGDPWPKQVCELCESKPQALGAETDEHELEAELKCRRNMAGSLSAGVHSTSSSLILKRWGRPIVLALQICCVVLTSALIGTILRIRKSRTIIVSGWLMLETMLVGALMLYMSVLVRYFQPTSLTCLVEPWLRELGFSTFYGSILIKLYRILTEFQTRKAHRVCLRDKDQIIYLLAIVFIVIGYMSAWTALMVDGFFVRQDAGQALNGVSSQSSSLPEGDAFFLPPTKNSQADGSESPMSNVQRSELVKRALGDLEQESSLTSPFSYDGQMPPFVARTITTTRPGSQLVDGGEQNKYHKPATNHHLELSAVPALVQNNSDLPPVYLNYHQGGGEDETRNMRRNPRETTSGLFNDHLEILAHGLNSFGELFLGLLESEQRFDLASDSYVLSIRCRKLTWDYVTESSEIALLLFGLHLVYKLRNASMDLHKEKLILGLAVAIELVISTFAYLIRHSLWHSLTGDHLLVLYAIRCQLTVTLTVVLVFGPKLWDIGKSKPSLLLSAVFGRSASNLLLGADGGSSGHHHGGHLGGASGGASGGGAGGGGGGQSSGARATSVRHRCHISCEVHDHHLNDATRLHQAMLSNSALEIGSINLADMDPDEIQAELKRVYTQLELLKTKVMRRDNPHISKRRGGRKPGHRKFSLQAFHGRHSGSGSGEHHPQNNSQNSTSSHSQPTTSSCGGGGDDWAQAQNEQMLQQALASTGRASSIARLPALAELDGESNSAGASSGRAHSPATTTTKHVRLDESHNQDQQDNSHGQHRQQMLQARGSSWANRFHRSRQQQYQHSNKWTPELPSTSSVGFDDEPTMNESQSSGELTPQHRSSIVHI